MKQVMSERLKKELNEKYAGYIILTCSHPNIEGKMEIDFMYEGDPALAAYMLESAQYHIEEEFQC